MAVKKSGSYDADDLKILEGLEAVRVRPGMYIGSTGVRGLHHILWEIVDNAIDEAANGYADEISVKLWKDGSASVQDNGRGMPTDINKKAGISGVELIFTKLHAGGKFDSGNYAFSGGLHGVGASVTNAHTFPFQKHNSGNCLKFCVPVLPCRSLLCIKNLLLYTPERTCYNKNVLAEHPSFRGWQRPSSFCGDILFVRSANVL